MEPVVERPGVAFVNHALHVAQHFGADTTAYLLPRLDSEAAIRRAQQPGSPVPTLQLVLRTDSFRSETTPARGKYQSPARVFDSGPNPASPPFGHAYRQNARRWTQSTHRRARANSNPPVMAKPLIAPIMGRSNASMTRTTSILPVVGSGSFKGALVRLSSLRSMPAQNARPAPVKITTWVSESLCNDSKALTISSRSARDKAFIAFGRFRVRVAIPSIFLNH